MTPHAPDHHELPLVFVNQPSVVPQRRLTASCNSGAGTSPSRAQGLAVCLRGCVAPSIRRPHVRRSKTQRPTSQLLITVYRMLGDDILVRRRPNETPISHPPHGAIGMMSPRRAGCGAPVGIASDHGYACSSANHQLRLRQVSVCGAMLKRSGFRPDAALWSRTRQTYCILLYMEETIMPAPHSGRHVQPKSHFGLR